MTHQTPGHQSAAASPSRGGRRRRTATAVVLLVFLACMTDASAAPVQQFGVQLKDITPDGRFSLVFTSNAFDTTGAAPPGLTEASVRFAKGVSIKPRFLRRERLCQTGKLKGVLLDVSSRDLAYGELLADLPNAQRRIGRKLTPVRRGILDTCREAFLGQGTFVVDARPLFGDPIPGSLYVFLAEPTARGARAGFGVMALYDRNSPVVLSNALVAEQDPVFTVNLFNEPTPDGVYGYRLRLLPENFGELPFSVAELRIESKGIVSTTEKRTCTDRRAGRCVKYRSKATSDFWADLPGCPKSSRLPFKAEYRYATGLRTSSVVQVPCPRFRR